MTREHIFRSSWKNKIDVSTFPPGSPLVERRFIRYRLDNTEIRSKLEDLFSIQVKRVCAPCNNTWMNDLDSVAEPWVFDPANDDNRCDPKKFRRWAIKVALLRSYYESPLAVEPPDPARLYAGDDIPEWHVFIGRTAHPDHRHAFAGVGPIAMETGGRVFGVTQVSWTLGHSFVIALRLIGNTNWTDISYRNLKGYNRSRGLEVMEILPTAKGMPSVRDLPALPVAELLRLVWFFTPNPLSPMSDIMRDAWDSVKEIAEQLGNEWRDEL